MYVIRSKLGKSRWFVTTSDWHSKKSRGIDREWLSPHTQTQPIWNGIRVKFQHHHKTSSEINLSRGSRRRHGSESQWQPPHWKLPFISMNVYENKWSYYRGKELRNGEAKLRMVHWQVHWRGIKVEAYELDGQTVHLGDTVTIMSLKHDVMLK